MPELVLTDLQMAILRVIWTRDGATVPFVTTALRDSRGLAQSTVATVMNRLEKRGVLRREGDPRDYVYHALVTEADVRRAMVQQLTTLLFDGEASALVSHLVEASEVDANDLEYAMELLREAEERDEE
jgi:predicted transcriptional regulator